MATQPIMRNLGAPAPGFDLPDVRTGETVSRAEFTERPLVVMFICNHCPYVKRIQQGLVALGNDYAATDVAIVGIAPNDPALSPADSPEELARVADELGYVFPLLFDEDQSVAKAYGAVCTPDLYVFDRSHHLVYRGQFDDARPSNDEPVTGRDLRTAIDAVLAGLPVPEDQVPPIGCSIKWTPGNEPA
jgi:peroxiredoxin